jgi:hypothetical protein
MIELCTRVIHSFSLTIKTSAMTSANVHRSATSPKLSDNDVSSSLFQQSNEQQMRNDASYHHVQVPRHSFDAMEQKETNDGLTSTVVTSSIAHISDRHEEESSGMVQVGTTIVDRPTDETLTVTSQISSSSNRITPTNAVQNSNDNNIANDVSLLNDNISSNATITAFHSISSDVSSSSRRCIPLSSFDQRVCAHENKQPLATGLPSAASLLLDEQANHANDEYRVENSSPDSSNSTSTNLEQSALKSLPSSNDTRQGTCCRFHGRSTDGNDAFDCLVCLTLTLSLLISYRRTIPRKFIDNSINRIITSN